MIDIVGLLSLFSISLIGGVRIGTRVLLVMKFKIKGWLGYIARLSEDYTPSRRVEKGGGSQHSVVSLPSLLGFMQGLLFMIRFFLLFAELVLL